MLLVLNLEEILTFVILARNLKDMSIFVLILVSSGEFTNRFNFDWEDA